MPKPWLVIAGLVAGLVGALVLHPRVRSPRAWIVLATVVALAVRHEASWFLLLPIALLGLVNHAPSPWRTPLLVTAVCLLVLATPVVPGLAAWVVGLPLLVLGGLLVLPRLRAAPLWGLITLASVAAYTAVPDTEEITVVGTAACAALPWALRSREPDDHGSVALLALFVWACAWGAAGRPASFVVAPALLLPVGVLALVGPAWSLTSASVLGSVYLALAVGISRTAGLEPEPWSALQLAALEVTLGCIVLGGLGWWLRPAER